MYVKRFLCGVDGVKVGAGSAEDLMGGVCERVGSWNVVPWFVGERFCGIDCGTVDSNISERRREE